MTTYCGLSLVKWFTFVLLLNQVLSAPKTLGDEVEIKKIFSESKRDVTTSGFAPVPLLKSPIFNPYFMYSPFIPGKPFFVPPFLPITPSDILLNRFGKSVSSASSSVKPPTEAADPSLMSAYFKAKKDEFLSKLYEKIANGSAISGVSKRDVSESDVPESTKPVIDSSFFLKKKYEFLETLFKTLNITPPAAANATDNPQSLNATAPPTPKPTIVSPDFWFPFAKPPKPTKAPKPTKPPKAKKILKDALDTILLQSLLIDMGVDPKDASLNKRAATLATLSKKSKSKKIKTEDDPTEFSNSSKMDSTSCSTKVSDCLSKLFKILNITDEEGFDGNVQTKPAVSQKNVFNKSSEAEYLSKLEAFINFIDSLNSIDYPAEKAKKPTKSFKSKPEKKIRKRSTFLDELLHRVPPLTTTTTTPEPTVPTEDKISSQDTECDIVQFLKQCCDCGDKCLEEKSGKSLRSLIFKPFGSGYWIPQYLYAAKMGMYLDKLMDSINTAAANEVESESSDLTKRSADSPEDLSGLSSKEAAINLIIAELTELKNKIVDAFADGVQAQKDASPTKKPLGPPGKSFKKPFWGFKGFPTVDPVAPIQKRIDILNDVFDKLTKVEKTLIFTNEPEYDPKLLGNLTEILEMNTKTKKIGSKDPITTSSANSESPEYFLNKTREYLKTLFDKTEESDNE